MTTDEVALRIEQIRNALDQILNMPLSLDGHHLLLALDASLRQLKQDMGHPWAGLGVAFWRCVTCGCFWRDNRDGSVSLANVHETACPLCEWNASATACEPLYRSGVAVG